MAERCQVCGTNVGCQSYGLAGGYKVMTCHTCINGITAAMHVMPEFLEWFVCERAMDAAAVAGLSADEIRKRSGEYFEAGAKLLDAVDAMIEKRSVFKNDVLPKLRPPVMPPDPEEVKPATVYALGYDQTYDDENLSVLEFGVYSTRELAEAAKPHMQQFIPHFEKYAGEWWIEAVEVDSQASSLRMRKVRREPVPPATVYALAIQKWYKRGGEVTLAVDHLGVFATREAMEAKKAEISSKLDALPQNNKGVIEVAWITWEGVPMDGKGATDPLDDIHQWVKANIPAARFEVIILEPAGSPVRSRVCWIDHKGKECLDYIPPHIKWPSDGSLEVIGHDACMKWLEGDANG